ncbi:MAG: hypothetical protein R3Y07_03030 [Eubacteriales bacterium]
MIEEITFEDFQLFLTELQENSLDLENGISDLYHLTSEDVISLLD